MTEDDAFDLAMQDENENFERALSDAQERASRSKWGPAAAAVATMLSVATDDPEWEQHLTEQDDEPAEDDEPDLPFPNGGQLLQRSELSTLPRVRSLVDGVLSYPAAVVLVGGYAIGKTTLAHGLAACVATGADWLGRKVDQHRVLVVVGEGPYGLHERISAFEYAWRAGQQIPDADLMFLIKPTTLAKSIAWTEITDYAVDGGFGFVILDTFSSLAPEADETKDAPLIMRWLSDLAAAIDGTALLIHHPGWSDAGRVRGGYSIEANADEVLVLTGVADSELVTLTRKKVKDGPGGGTLWLRRTPMLNSVVMKVAGAQEMDTPLRSRILLVLDNMADLGATGPQIRDELGIEKAGASAFYKALRLLVDEDIVIETGRGNLRRYYLAGHAPAVLS